jgi:hypothetical protein
LQKEVYKEITEQKEGFEVKGSAEEKSEESG